MEANEFGEGHRKNKNVTSQNTSSTNHGNNLTGSSSSEKDNSVKKKFGAHYRYSNKPNSYNRSKHHNSHYQDPFSYSSSNSRSFRNDHNLEPETKIADQNGINHIQPQYDVQIMIQPIKMQGLMIQPANFISPGTHDTPTSNEERFSRYPRPSNSNNPPFQDSVQSKFRNLNGRNRSGVNNSYPSRNHSSNFKNKPDRTKFSNHQNFDGENPSNAGNHTTNNHTNFSANGHGKYSGQHGSYKNNRPSFNSSSKNGYQSNSRNCSSDKQDSQRKSFDNFNSKIEEVIARKQNEISEKFKNKLLVSDQFDEKSEKDNEEDIQSLKDRVLDQLTRGIYECMVCCESIKQTNPIWSCTQCYHCFHLLCIKKWAQCENSSIADGEGWRCPGCQTIIKAVPTKYICFCGKKRHPYWNHHDPPHTCGEVCKKSLKGEACPHFCSLLCHPGPCQDCTIMITKECECKKTSQVIRCGKRQFVTCQDTCNKRLNCGVHFCESNCHPGECEECQKDIEQKNHHKCQAICHEGSCPPCPLMSSVECQCGFQLKEISCSEIGTNAIKCEKRCYKKLSCKRHKCLQNCCSQSKHKCDLICDRRLSCQLHTCTDQCHSGDCSTCWQVCFDELHCECGAAVIYPPIPCGTKRPKCDTICSRQHPCEHPVHHSCHDDAECPPCTFLVSKWCYGKHELRKNIPCYLEYISCGKSCGNHLPCEMHTCQKTCHAGDCHDEKKCEQLCNKPRSGCGHPCGQLCHKNSDCPSSVCKYKMKVTCECGRKVERISCYEYNNPTLSTSKLAAKAHDVRSGQVVNLKDMSKYKWLDCDTECAATIRNRQLALALQIVNPDISTKLGPPPYSDWLKNQTKANFSYVNDIVNKLNSLVTLSKEPPPEFTCHGGGLATPSVLSRSWDKWVEQFDFFMTATERNGKSGEVKVALLLSLLGPQCMDIYRTFNISDIQKKDLEVVKASFKAYFSPKLNEVFERHRFLSRAQKEAEPFDMFLTDLYNLSSSCNYEGVERDKAVRDRIVMGVNNASVQKHLLSEEDLTLDRAIQLCRAKEATVHYLEDMRPNTSEASAAVTRTPEIQRQALKNCKFCGLSHVYGNCPAFGKKCRRCSRKGHFEKRCFQAKNASADLVDRYEDSTPEESVDFVFSITNADKKEWFVKLLFHNHVVRIKVDTGATCNIMSQGVYRSLKGKEAKIRPTKVQLHSYSGHKLSVLGTVRLIAKFRGKSFPLTFIVVEEKATTLLGLGSCSQLGLIQISNAIQSVNTEIRVAYQDVFQGVGELPQTYSLNLKSDAVPIVQAARRVPHRLRDKLKQTLDDMESRNYIAKIREGTDWVHPIVTVLKPSGELRVCLDPSYLNKAIKREHYAIPTASEIFAKLCGSTVFTTLDAVSGFMQIRLDEDSSKLTTFATPFGRYRMRLRNQRYDYRLVYVPGKDLILADTLSRAHVKDEYPEAAAHSVCDFEQVNAIVSGIAPRLTFRDKLARTTANDPVLHILESYIVEGWPKTIKACPDVVKPYWKLRSELSVHEGLILRNNQIVIPAALRKDTMKCIHTGHMGIIKCLERAKGTVYWPGYTNQIEDLVRTCSICQENMRALNRVQLEPYDIPEYPMQMIAIDIFFLNGKSFLLTIDRNRQGKNVSSRGGQASSSQLEVGQKVRCKLAHRKWGKAEILQHDSHPNSYWTRLEGGSVVRRNRSFLRPTNEKFSINHQFEHQENPKEPTEHRETNVPSADGGTTVPNVHGGEMSDVKQTDDTPREDMYVTRSGRVSKHKSRSHVFPPTKRDNRRIIHELAEYYGCESQSIDEAINRNVIVTAVKNNCWIPSTSIITVVSREMGVFKAPPPITLRSLKESSQNTPKKTIDYFNMKPL
ncbi:Transcriptional repressor NF-X1 [Nymphon striatum]|nr:Transcriptional repressor NF-X1 [Nymphon striatum]